MLAAADDHVRLNTHSLQLLDGSLGGLCLQLTGCFNIRNECYMNEDRIFPAHLMLELADGLEERLAFDVADGSAYLDDGNMCILGCVIAVKTALDLIGNMRNDLNRSSAVVSAALLLKHRPVNFSGSNIRIFG